MLYWRCFRSSAPTGSLGAVMGGKKKYTLGYCIRECLSFNTIRELSKAKPMLYKVILENKWQGKCFTHMTKPISKRRKGVVMLSKDDVFLKSFDAISMAIVFLNKNVKSGSTGAISNVCKGVNKTAHGYKWMYKEDYNKLIQNQ